MILGSILDEEIAILDLILGSILDEEIAIFDSILCSILDEEIAILDSILGWILVEEVSIFDSILTSIGYQESDRKSRREGEFQVIFFRYYRMCCSLFLKIIIMSRFNLFSYEKVWDGIINDDHSSLSWCMWLA